MEKIKRTKITEQIFNTVKLILKGGTSAKETAETLGISVNSVHRIKKSESYPEYVEFARMNGSNRYAEPKELPGQTEINIDGLKVPVPESEAKGFELIREAILKQTEVLELLSSKVSFIVDELTK